MQDSVFTKIIKGELPSHTVYEDDTTMAVMDIFPVQPGMVVVFPKEQIANFEDMSPETAAAVIHTTQKIMRAQRKVFPEKKKIGVQIAGINTPDHTHTTVFPIDSGDEFMSRTPDEQADSDALAALAEQIKAAL